MRQQKNLFPLFFFVFEGRVHEIITNRNRDYKQRVDPNLKSRFNKSHTSTKL